jgi:hypothetical protein
MKATNPWITYRTRFLVNAKQLTTSLTFTDALGRQHSGRKGDYLVESEGVLRIQPRHIFEDIYVPLSADESPSAGRASSPATAAAAIPAEKMSPASDRTIRSKRPAAFSLSPLARKSPQPYRDRQSTAAGFRSV